MLVTLMNDAFLFSRLRLAVVLGLLSAAVSAAGQSRVLEVDLFRQGEGGVHTYRIPALVQTRQGTLIAVADARHDSARDLPARISLVMRRSFDGGRHWTPAQIVLPAPEGGGVGDPSLLLDRATGRVWCFHAYGPPGIGFATAKPGAVTGPSTMQVHAMHSDDDGATWSAPEDLTPQLKRPEWQAVFATSGTHFQTSKGRFLVPLVVRDAAGVTSSRNAWSDDHGLSWHTGEALAPGSDESKAIELKDGTILQNARQGSRRTIGRSADGGVTFGPVEHDDALIDPVCNAGLARYTRGRKDVVIFTNAASTKRENLTLRLSYDGGRSWPVSRVLYSGPAAYSTAIPLKDGSIAVLYERGDQSPYERITFTIVK
jgi:sialidase-1